MIKTSTQTPNSLPKEIAALSETSEELGEEELSFYDRIKNDLTQLEVKPKSSVIEKILSYSRSL